MSKLLFFKRLLVVSLILFTQSFFLFAQEKSPVLVIHGGAGTILKKNMSTEMEEAYLDFSRFRNITIRKRDPKTIAKRPTK